MQCEGVPNTTVRYQMRKEKADVLVIGSGAAGAAVTERLSSHGVKVVCLEQGKWVDAKDYPSADPDWEVSLRRGPWNMNPNTRRLPEDYPVVTGGSDPPRILMFNAVGGSTIHWAAHFVRFHPSDFRVHSLDGVGDDWPITYEDLEEYYEANDRVIGVSGLAGDPANPPRSPRPTPPLPLGMLGEKIGSGFNNLGWYWWVSDNAIISRFYNGRPGCALHGKCQYGCPIAAKASTDVTYWPKALKQGAVLTTRARVREISLDSQGRARGAVYFDAEGNLQEQLARVVVICCNGVGTPRLLLNSKSKLFPDGLANSSGQVGKNFMLHPFRFVEGVFEERMDGWKGPYGIPAMSQHFYETDPTRGFVRGYTFLLERSHGPVHQAWGGHTGNPIPWGKDHHRVMKERFAHIIRVSVMGEDLPKERNRVELDSEAKDSNEIPGPRVLYHLSQNSRRMLDHGARMAKRVLEAAGAYKTFDSGPVQPVTHLMGTARMGSHPGRSVVNKFHQAHDVENLFIVDGSSFVTAAAVNPTSTIGALALRAADTIWHHRQEWV